MVWVTSRLPAKRARPDLKFGLTPLISSVQLQRVISAATFILSKKQSLLFFEYTNLTGRRANTGREGHLPVVLPFRQDRVACSDGASEAVNCCITGRAKPESVARTATLLHTVVAWQLADQDHPLKGTLHEPNI